MTLLSPGRISARLGREIRIFQRQRKIRHYLRDHSVPKLQLGCGTNLLEGWLNSDLEPSVGMIYLDIRRRFPFENEAFSYVFSEHAIEHISYQQGLRCLSECFRVLGKSGKIRIATPNLAFLLGLYNRQKDACQRRYLDWTVKTFGFNIEIPSEVFAINNFFRNWGHQFIYDFNTLEIAMKQAGFTNIKQVEVLESDDPIFRGLESHGRVIPAEFNKLETMVLEGLKTR